MRKSRVAVLLETIILLTAHRIPMQTALPTPATSS